jgi:hypothetical protein
MSAVVPAGVGRVRCGHQEKTVLAGAVEVTADNLALVVYAKRLRAGGERVVDGEVRATAQEKAVADEVGRIAGCEKPDDLARVIDARCSRTERRRRS